MVQSMSGNTPDNGNTEEWIQLALREYEQIASLCNAQSILGNAATSLSASASTADDVVIGHGDLRDLDPKVLTREMQRRSLQGSLSNYYEGIGAVRKTHTSMKSQLCRMQEDVTANYTNCDDNEQPTSGRRPPPQSPTTKAFSRHIELSERVIRTVMRSSPGQCGVLFQNGLVRTASAGDHEANVVALTALRASVSQLKAKFGRGSG